jgi:hypothetical protein
VSISGTGFYVRAMGNGSYRVENVKGMRVSTGNAYPTTTPCESNYYSFSKKIFICVDGNNYYKIVVNDR